MTTAEYIQKAKQLYERDGEIEIDADATVSEGDDPGAYVQAWVWVPSGEAETGDEDAGEDGFVMENDGAVIPTNEVISLVRETCTAETQKSVRDRLREMLAAHMAEQGLDAFHAIADFTADLRHLAIEHDEDYEQADWHGYEHFEAECDTVDEIVEP